MQVFQQLSINQEISQFKIQYNVINIQYNQQLNNITAKIAMAFVSCSQRKFDPSITTPQNLGPGSYQNPAAKSNSYGAPFLSTSIRPNIQNIPKALMPGPGDYDIRTNIADPVIQAMANSRNIIVKINSTGTGPFKSTQNRFNQYDSIVPGPGAYNANSMEAKRKRSKDRVHIKRPKLYSENKRRSSSIPHKGASLYVENQQKQEILGEVGPGAYEISQPIGNSQKGALWGKDAIERFKRKQETTLTNMGPGKYYVKAGLGPQYKANPSSSFVSETVRTYFDKMVYKTNQNIKAKLRMQAKYKSSEPGPGLYNPNNTQKHSSAHIFGYEERFKEQDVQTPGPGVYNSVSPKYHVPKKQQLHISFESKTEREPLFFSYQKNVPGPGAYDDIPNNKFKYSYGTTSFVNGCQRFVNKIVEEQEPPGPGSYIQSSKTVPVRKPMSTFKSNTKRIWHQEMGNVSVGNYNLNQTDISTKVQKQKSFIDNLRKIQVEKAPFDTSNTRFKHYEDVKKPEPKADPERQFLPPKKVRTAVPSPQPRSQHPGFFAGETRFRFQKKKSPSVGSYNLANGLESKSFNVKFQRHEERDEKAQK